MGQTAPKQVPYPKPGTSVDRWLDGWVESLAVNEATTRTAYVSDVAPARDLAAMQFLVTTGLRQDEFVDAKLSDLVEDETGAHIIIPGRAANRVVPVPDDTLDAVHEYLEERDNIVGPATSNDHLFVRATGLPFDGRSLYRLTARLFERAGIPLRSGSMVHLLRCTYVENARDAGVRPDELQRLLGHERIASTTRFLAAGSSHT